MDTGQPFN